MKLNVLNVMEKLELLNLYWVRFSTVKDAEGVLVKMASKEEIEAADKALRFYGTTLSKERIAAALDAANKKPNRNNCPKCSKSDSLERRYYDMMWGEAELWCTHCEVKVRDLDFG
jgi:hypothetical protein